MPSFQHASTTYTQPVKGLARETVLRSAVQRLTTRRAHEAVVTAATFQALWRHCVLLLRSQNIPVADDDESILRSWLDFHRSRLGSRQPRDLKVVYLAGPEPLNDLSTLLRLGVSLENIWGRLSLTLECSKQPWTP